MNSIIHRHSRGKSNAAALCATSFLFLLIYSTPHRVHHFFETTGPVDYDQSPDHHGKSNNRDKPAPDADCVFQVAAHRCVFGVTEHAEPLTVAVIASDFRLSRESVRQPRFSAAAFQIRAPPII